MCVSVYVCVPVRVLLLPCVWEEMPGASLSGMGLFHVVQARPGLHGRCMVCLMLGCLSPKPLPAFSVSVCPDSRANLGMPQFPQMCLLPGSQGVISMCVITAVLVTRLVARGLLSLVPWESCTCVHLCVCHVCVCVHSLLQDPGVSPPGPAIYPCMIVCLSWLAVGWRLVWPRGRGSCPACVCF